MGKLELIDMFKALKLELYKETMYKIIDRINPNIREALIIYLLENSPNET